LQIDTGHRGISAQIQKKLAVLLIKLIFFQKSLTKILISIPFHSSESTLFLFAATPAVHQLYERIAMALLDRTTTNLEEALNQVGDRPSFVVQSSAIKMKIRPYSPSRPQIERRAM